MAALLTPHPLHRYSPPPPLYNSIRFVDAPCPQNIQRIDHGCLPLLDQMHTNGILVDQSHFQALDSKLAAIEQGQRLDIDSLVGDVWRGFDPDSPDQVSELLF